VLIKGLTFLLHIGLSSLALFIGGTVSQKEPGSKKNTFNLMEADADTFIADT